jgi:hypothetical protein
VGDGAEERGDGGLGLARLERAIAKLPQIGAVEILAPLRMTIGRADGPILEGWGFGV